MAKGDDQVDEPEDEMGECSVNEAAKILGCSPWTVYQHVRSGALPARRIGLKGRWRVQRQALKPGAMPSGGAPAPAAIATGSPKT